VKEFDEELSKMPELSSLRLKPYVKSPKHCPKCGRGPVPFPAWAIRWLDLAWSRFDIGYCRGGLAATVEHEVGPFKQECHPICAGQNEPHLHVTCVVCKHSFLMEPADRRKGVFAKNNVIAKLAEDWDDGHFDPEILLEQAYDAGSGKISDALSQILSEKK
jgi:hypothetical protein